MRKPDKFFKAVGGIGAQLAALCAPIVMATPTASFSGIAPASPSIPLSRPTPAAPKAITAWTQPVKKGDQYSIKASCYNISGTTAAGIPVHPDKNSKPVVAVPEGTTHNMPFGTIVKLTHANRDPNPVYAVVADTGGFGQTANGKRHGVNPNAAMDLYSPVARNLGFPSCKIFGKQGVVVEIVKVPPKPESYAGGKKQTEASLAKLANTKQL